jgi:predicted metal-dependent peptidase
MSKEAEKKISKARVAMIFDAPFYGYLSLNLEVVEDNNMQMKTMATDGKRLIYDSDFVMGLGLEELQGVIAHEIAHVVLWHIPRRQGRDPEKWNYAADYAANDLVVKDFKLPPGCLLPKDKLKDKFAEFIYNNIPDPPKNGKGRFDDHGVWKEWGKDPGDGQGNQPGGNQPNGMDGMEAAWREKVAQAANAARMKGKLPAHIGDLVDGILQPKLSWQALLRDTVTSCAKSDFRMNPPNKKMLNRGFYFPSLTGEEIKVGCGIDTSGSVSLSERKEMLSEVFGICEQYENHTIWLWTADADIAQEFEIHEFDELPRKLEGGGGTDFRPICKRADEKDISVLIYFTDLCGEFPEKPPRIPVIWVSVDPNAKAPFGTVIPYPRDKK